MAFVCHYCGKSFTSAEKLRAHKAVHDETLNLLKLRIPPLRCLNGYINSKYQGNGLEIPCVAQL